MKGFLPIFKRELRAMVLTPMAWILLLVFLLVQGAHFDLLVEVFSRPGQLAGDQAPSQSFFGSTVVLYFVLFLLVPPITMRSFAEERRSGTMESLLSAPVSATGMVLAKFAASLVIYIALWIPTVLYLVILQQISPVDWQAALAGYLGVILVGASFLSVGLFMSSLTKSQFLALIGTALVVLALFLIGVGERVEHPGSLWYEVGAHVSVWSQMYDFSTGIVDTRRLVFDLSSVALFLFLSVKSVESWRWE